VARPEPAQLVSVARVSSAHGIRGELKVRLHWEGSEALHSGSPLWIGGSAQEASEVTLQRVRPGGRGTWIVAIEGLRDRSAAERMRGLEFFVDSVDLPEPEEDEFYYRDLEGLRVLSTTGAALGTVERIFATGANDVLVIRQGERELLLPFIDDVVVEVDQEGRRLVVEPLEGMLEG